MTETWHKFENPPLEDRTTNAVPRVRGLFDEHQVEGQVQKGVPKPVVGTCFADYDVPDVQRDVLLRKASYTL